MLQFLPMIAMGLQGMSALSGMANTARGYQQTQAERAQLQAMANQERLLKAYLDPNDPIMKNMSAAESRMINEDQQQGLSNLLAANRKAQLMGRQAFFNPERQDEAVSQWLNKGVANNANIARSNALQRIMQAVTGYGGSASGYGGMIPNQQQAQAMDRSRGAKLFDMGARALGGGGSLSNIFRSLGGGGGMAGVPDGTDIGRAMPWLYGAG